MIRAKANSRELQEIKTNIISGIAELRIYTSKMQKVVDLIRERHQYFESRNADNAIERLNYMITLIERTEAESITRGNKESLNLNKAKWSRKDNLLIENWEDEIYEIV